MKYFLLAAVALLTIGCMRIEIVPIKIGSVPEKHGLSFMNEKEASVETNDADAISE